MAETRRPRRCVKLIAAFLSGIFAFTQVLFAHVPTLSVWEGRRTAQSRIADDRLARLIDTPAPLSAIIPAASRPILNSDRLRGAFKNTPAASLLKLLPPDIVTVRDLVVPSAPKGPLSGRRFIVVQDVHLNADAQRNIAELLFRLMGAGQAGIVAVEGAVGGFDLARFRSYPDVSVTDAVARAFLLSDRIGAPSFAGITSKSEPPVFWGVDDAEHYDRNVDAYRAGLKGRPDASKAVAAETKTLSSAKRIAYTPELVAIDIAAASYESGEQGLGEYLEFLSRTGALALVPSDQRVVADRFLEAWRLERHLDFDRADRERRAALEKLVSKLSTGEIDGLVQLSLGYRDGRLAFGVYHRAISDLIASKGVSLDNLPAFQSYLRYVLLSDGINADQLLAATSAAQKAAFDRAATTSEQRRLIAASRNLTLRKKLLEFALTPAEWTEYVDGKTQGLSSRGGPQGPRNDTLQAFEDFYREAHVRSERIAENLAAAAQRTDGSKIGVLIVGGFHAPDVVRRLAQMGASTAVVSPRLTKVEAASGTAYLSVFSREKTPLQKLFEGEKLFVYPAYLDIGAAGVHTDAANNEFEAAQVLTGQIRSGRLDRGVAKATVSGRDYAAVPAGARVPFGYRAVQGAVELVDGSPVQFVRRTTIGALFAAVPLQMTGWFSRLMEGLGLSKETAARLSFLEEVLYTGLLVYALPWALVTFFGVPPQALAWLRPTMLFVSSFFFALDHAQNFHWTRNGRIEGRPAGMGTFVLSLGIGILFRSAFFFGFDAGTVIGTALAAHAFWNNLAAPFLRFLPVMMTAPAVKRWWQIPEKKYISMSVPIYALRRDPSSDPGIGKFSDLARTYREELAPNNVNVVLLLPHYATLDESPYATVSLFAVQERYIDWSQVPEVYRDPELLAALVAPASAQDEVDYQALGKREDRVAAEAHRRFMATIGTDRERRESFNLFLRQNRGWLGEYADFMAVHQILDKSSMEWTDDDVIRARADARYQPISDLHAFKQWIGYRQFAEALNDVQAAGGHVLVDIPFFRAKDGVSVRNSPQYFRDPKNRSAGIRNAQTDQTWGDLALWNWPELARGSFDFVLGPIRHWLRFGVDGARNDATHFYYRIGQFGDNDEPGDAVVSRLASTFEQYGALPVAEAFENKGDEVARRGFVVIDGNWQRVSTHDDGSRPHFGNPVNFIKDLLGRLFRKGDPRTSQFIAYTLGDFDGDSRTVKRMEDGKSLWRYRRSLSPLKDLGRLVRFQSKDLPELLAKGRPVWDATADVRHQFEAAAESFVRVRDGVPEIWAASRDWFFEQWGRDTFIALPGILLATRRFDVARDVIRGFARFERNGLIPNRIWDPNNPDSIEYNTSDASLWFIQAIKTYFEATGDQAFVDEMAPVMRRIMQAYVNGTGWDGGKHINNNPDLNDRRIAMDPADGLISVPGQSTWMDADPHGQGAVTPRHGKPVEINALWYSNLRFLERVTAGQTEAAEEHAQYARLAGQVKTTFNQTFWNAREEALYDMAPGGPHNGALRPNMLFAISHGDDLLSPEHQRMVFERAQADLWTPYGPRTLSPRDSNYKSRYETNRQPYPGEPDFMNHKDYAYHQGTVWPWLIGPYVDSLVKVRRNQGVPIFQIQEEIRTLLTPIVTEFVNSGSLHEVYDGSPRLEDGRQHPGGTSSQAWSVGEVYRVLSDYGVLGLEGDPETLSDEGIVSRLRIIASNYQQRFRIKARNLVARLTEKTSDAWTADDRADAAALIQESSESFDWRRGWAARSKHYAQFRNHPIFLLSLEARVSASQNASNRAEFEEFRRNNHDRLTTNQGGLGDLAGGWLFGGLGDMGMATTFDPQSEAPEAYAFLPNYRQGSRLSRIRADGWPISDSQNEAWSAVRPQDVGIGLIPDPDDAARPLTVTVPVNGIGEVAINFRAVEKDGIKIIMIETDGNDTPEKQSIFDRMYQGSLSSEDRFRQQWVYGVAVEKFKQRYKLPDGPVHLNETATFVTLIARVRDHTEKLVQEGVPFETAYEIAMEQVGQQLIFFTHTLVEAGVDRFFSNIAFGDYIRELFEESTVLTQEQAWEATGWLVHGKASQVHGRDLPGFWFDRKGEAHYSPLNFVANLAYQFQSEVVAVSRLNAVKAGEFLVGAKILQPEQVEAKAVNAVTNAVDELFFYDRRIVKAMNLEEPDPAKRHPERILNPNDPKARELHRIATGGREIPADYTQTAMPDSEYKAIKDENRGNMVQRVRWAMQDQYVRNIREITEGLKDRGLAPDQRADMTARLETLTARWESWTGQPFPKRLEDMKGQELVNLLDPAQLTMVWARRIVEYKRMLLSVFGENLPLVEKLVEKMPETAAGIDELIDTLIRETGSTSLDQLVQPFLDMVEKERTQLIFAGPTFDYKGRAMVAILDRMISRLSVNHPTLTNRVVYVEGYNDELSHYLVQGADIWLNNPKRPLEASGTSSMKRSLSATVLDGWAADNGFEDLNVIAIRPSSPDLSLDHPDEWAESEQDPEKRARYLREEAASLYSGLRRASALFYNAPGEWMNFDRRAYFYNATVFSVRSSFTGRYIPTSDPSIITAGWETGIFELYDRTITRMEAGRPHVDEMKRFGRLKAGLHFITHQSKLTFGAGSNDLEASVELSASAETLADADIFFSYGTADEEWTTIRVPADNISRNAAGVVTARVGLSPQGGGTFGVTVFAAPKNSSNENLRVWGNGFDQDAEFDREPVAGSPEQFTNILKGTVAPGLVGAWKGSSLSTDAKSGLEGVAIGLLALGVIVVAVLLLSLGMPSPSISDGALMALLSSILAMIFVSAAILAAHLRLGVLQTDDSIALDAGTAVRASIAASSSLLSIPFFTYAVVLLKVGAISPSAAAVLILIGFSVAIVAHIATNRRILSGIRGENVDASSASLAPIRVLATPSGRASHVDRPVPLGLIGVWENFPRLSYGVASIIESLFITLVAVCPLVLVVHGFSGDSALTAVTLWNLVQEAVRISLLIAGVMFPSMLLMHLVFGVMQPGPQRQPIWGWGVSVRATVVAMSSLIGFPLIVMANLAWRSGVDLTVIGVIPMVSVGILIGAMAHRRFNLRLLEWYAHRHPRGQRDMVLTPGVRQKLVDNSQVLINFLAERNVTEVGPEVLQLRDRTIDTLPEGIVHPINDRWADSPVDVMVVLGSHYLDVPARAARLYYHLRQNNPNLMVVFAGGMGPRTQFRFPYWNSEAELFRDRFLTSFRMIRRSSLERRFRLAAQEAMGRYTGVFVQLVLLIDDLLHGYVTTAPRAIFLETESTNTGANILNVSKIFHAHKVQPRNILLVTADVFQLRARASWLQQYDLPMSRVYSWAANHTDLSQVSDHDVVELADEAHSQIEKLRSYPITTPHAFSVPVPIPEAISRADEQVLQVLDQTNLLGFAKTSPDEKQVRKYPASFLTAFMIILGVLGAIASLPGRVDSAFWRGLVAASFGTAAYTVASILVGCGVLIMLFSESIGFLNEARVKNGWKPVVRFLRVVVPSGVALTYFLISMEHRSTILAWVSVLVTLLLGSIMRAWAMAVERARETARKSDEPPPTPPVAGAAGFWATTGLSLRSIGAIEGAATAAISLMAMGIAVAVALLIPNAFHMSSLGAWVALTATGLSAGAAVVHQVHQHFGVTVRPGAEPSFDPATIARATRTAYLSLAGVPLLAAGLLMPSLPAVIIFFAGLAVAIVPHALANSKAERAPLTLSDDEIARAHATADILASLNAARRDGDERRIAAALAVLTDLERLNLDAFGREIEIVRDDAQVAERLETNPGAYVSWQYALNSAADNRGTFADGTVGEFVSSSVADLASAEEQNRRDHVAIVATGASEADLISETNSALDVADGRPLKVILTGEGQDAIASLASAFAARGVTFVRQSDLASARDIEETLLRPALNDAGRLKLLINRDTGLPDFLVGPLLELGRQDRYRDLVDFVIVTALANGAFAVRASLSDIERAITFRDLVLSQA